MKSLKQRLHLYIFRDQSLKWVFSLFFGALLVRLGCACYSSGFNHPDEHFQLLEPAYGLVHGYWTASWEWERGIRSWFGPLIFAAWIWILERLGVNEAETLAIGCRVATGFLSLGVIWGTFQIGLKTIGKRTAWVAALIISFGSPFLYYGVHPLSETLSMSFVLPALAWVIGKRGEINENPDSTEGPKDREILLAALFSTVAFGFRFQSGFFALSCVLILLGQKRYRQALLYCGALSFGFLGIGLLDLWTWGQFFHSAIEYFKFNILENGVQNFGTEPWHRYITALNRFFSALPSLLILGFSALALRKGATDRWRIWPVLVAILPYFLVHQWISHKEDRFLLPILPLVILWSVAGWNSFSNLKWISPQQESLFDWTLASLLIASNFYLIFTHSWKWHSDITEFYTRIGEEPEMRGLLVCGEGIHRTGGNFYLHRPIPIHITRNQTNCSLSEVPEKYNYLLFNGENSKIFLSKKGQVRCEGVPIVKKTTKHRFFRCSVN